MPTQRTNRNPPLLQRIVADRLWGPAPFLLLDVGASGGIEPQWRLFGDTLRAVGFEPLLSEVDRLNHAAAPNISYEAAFVTCHDFDRLFPPDLRNDAVRCRSNEAFGRSSASHAQRLMQMDYTKEMFNAGAPAVYADRHIVLDDYVPAAEYGTVDFIKIDTDGHDIEVVLGTEAMLRAGGVLGFSIEAQFHGAAHAYANTFANIDRVLRDYGFTLFDLETYRYSRSALPAPFVYDIPAQTTAGPVLWGEAVYFRDFGDVDYERKFRCEITPQRVLKLACLFDLFGLPDCAAELLLVRGAFLDPHARELLMNSLVPSDEGLTYSDYMQAFEENARSLYASNRKKGAQNARRTEMRATEATAAGSPRLDATEAELGRLRACIDDLRSNSRKLEERLGKRDEQLQKLRTRIGKLKAKAKLSRT